jgi:hypothetical protein
MIQARKYLRGLMSAELTKTLFLFEVRCLKSGFGVSIGGIIALHSCDPDLQSHLGPSMAFQQKYEPRLQLMSEACCMPFCQQKWQKDDIRLNS